MNKRIVYADLLRIFATFSVVVLHVAASNWGVTNPSTYEWKIFNIYDSFVRYAVPIFIMVSGMFFLNSDKKIIINDIYNKYIFRIVLSYIFWSFFYSFYLNNFHNSFNFKTFMNDFIFGRYHLWFLYVIVGLYAITPLLRKIVTDKILLEYFLLLSVLFTFILPNISKILYFTKFDVFINKFSFHFAFGYVGYYAGGYYLENYHINKKIRYIIYLLGILGIFITIVFTDIISVKNGTANSSFYSYFSTNVLLASIGVFLFFKYEVSKITFGEKFNPVINLLSSCSFGIYVIHDFFIVVLSKLGINTMMFNPVISVPLISLIVFILSFALSYLISKIPILNSLILNPSRNNKKAEALAS